MSKNKFAMAVGLSFLVMGGVWALCAFVLFPATILADSVMGTIILIITVIHLIKNYKKRGKTINLCPSTYFNSSEALCYTIK